MLQVRQKPVSAPVCWFTVSQACMCQFGFLLMGCSPESRLTSASDWIAAGMLILATGSTIWGFLVAASGAAPRSMLIVIFPSSCASAHLWLTLSTMPGRRRPGIG